MTAVPADVLFAWALSATAASLVVLAMVVIAEIRDHRARERARRVLAAEAAEPVRPPRIPEQRKPTSVAAIVVVHDAESFDRFLAELIMTPHVEDVLS